jgi:hypothetical protein
MELLFTREKIDRMKATRLTGVAIQALVVYTGESRTILYEIAIDSRTRSRLPDTSMEDAPLVKMAYLDQSSPICIRSINGKRILQPQDQM